MIEQFRTVNEYNTPLDVEFYSDINSDVAEEINSAIDEIVFISRLVSKDMPTIADLPKDELGRIVVDVTNPHRLENMSYFTKAAEFFRENGAYTLYPINKHPKSAYSVFWREEKRRIREGLVREDGEWITGNLYWYWNYCPIMKTKRVGKGKRSIRIHDFGDIWLGDYLFYHYIDQAKDLGQHAELLKVRGIGNSFKMGAIGPRNALFVEKSKTFYVAHDMQYLTKDGVITKAWDYLDFLAEHTPFPRLRVKDTALEKRIGYKDTRTGSEKGMKSDIMGISTKDDPDKIRGKRGDIIFEEYGAYPHIKKAWALSRASVEDGDNVFAQLIAGGCVCAGTKVWTSDGRVINIEDIVASDGIIGFGEKLSVENISYIKEPSRKDCVKIKTLYRELNCSNDHPILCRKKHERNSHNENRCFYYTKEWVNAADLKKGDVILCADEIDIWGNDKLFDARFVGMLIGDGSYGMRRHYNKMEYKTPCFSNCDDELNNYILSNYSCNVELERPTKDGRTYREISIRDMIQNLKDIGIAGQSKDRKRLPTNFTSLNKLDSALLLAGLFDTDGCVQYTQKNASSISISQSSREMLEQIKFLLEKFGVVGVIRTYLPRICEERKDKNPWYELNIRSMRSIENFYKNIPIMIRYKNDALSNIITSFSKKHRKLNEFDNIREEYISSVEDIGVNYIHNLTTDATHTYLCNNIITHNTGGSEGSDFEGAEDMFYYPASYNVFALPNVYDRNTNGAGQCGFFWGAYLNRANCYDENGMPNVTKALKDLFIEVDRIRKSSSDPRALTQRKAEYPITPQDSMMRVDGTLFAVADIREYLEKIMPRLEEFVGPHYIGDLAFNPSGVVEWRVNGYVKPIREFPLQDNKYEGAIEIFERPFILNGEAQRNRYIAGIDPYDDDSSNTVSLGSIFVMDLFTDRMVCEYTGRPKFANDFYEMCRRILLYYNAIANYENDKKGLFQYFDRKNSLYLLSDTLQSLKDVEMIKGNMWGNKNKGTNSGKFINARARRLLADYLLSKAHGNQEDNKEVLNLHKIRSIGLLLECMKWNINGNYDRVSACGMLMLLREDRQKFLENSMSNENNRSKSFAFDDYFLRNAKGTLRMEKDDYSYNRGVN
jgi:intein/homing endonuclease